MIRVGLIGTGRWARHMLRVVEDAPETRVSAVCDLDTGRLAEAARRLPTAYACTDIQELFSDPDVDAVYVATPPATHAELARRAIAAGKHVLVEKPMATDAATAQALRDAAAAAGLVLMVGHTFVHAPPVRHVGRLIADGTLGKLHYIEVQRVNLGRHQPGGVLWDLGPHDLSILLHWLGEVPVEVSATGRACLEPGCLDVAFVHLKFSGGLVAQLHLSWLAPVKVRRMTVSGSRRMVVYDDLLGPEAVKVYDRGVERLDLAGAGPTYRVGDVALPQLPDTEPLRAEWDAFIDAIRTGRRPASDADQGVAVARILEAAAASIASRRPEPVGAWSGRGA